MGNRESISEIEFVNKSDIAKVDVTVGNELKSLRSNGICKFEITVASPSVIKGYDKSGKLIHELKLTIGHTASSQVWKITNSGVKHKRSPFFTETYGWNKK